MEAYRDWIIAAAWLALGSFAVAMIAAWLCRKDIRLPAPQRQSLRRLTTRAGSESDTATVIAALACYDLLLRVRENGDSVAIMCADGSIGPFPCSRQEFRDISERMLDNLDAMMTDKKSSEPDLGIFTKPGE